MSHINHLTELNDLALMTGERAENPGLMIKRVRQQVVGVLDMGLRVGVPGGGSQHILQLLLLRLASGDAPELLRFTLQRLATLRRLGGVVI